MFNSTGKLTLWHQAAFGDFRKKRLNARCFCGNISALVWVTDLVKASKNAASLLVKNFLLEGCRFFVSDVISKGFLGHLGPVCLALGANP